MVELVKHLNGRQKDKMRTCFLKSGRPIICIGISPNASRHVVTNAVNMTLPRVKAPADVLG